MKNKFKFQLLLMAAATLIGVLVFKSRKEATAPVVAVADIDFSSDEAKKAKIDNTVLVKAARSPKKTLNDVDLKKCASFLSRENADTLEKSLMQIKKNVRFQTDSLEMVEYQLFGSKNEEIVVQKNINEEKSDQVRVFKIAADGLPDRLKNFPNSNMGMDQKLDGALSLGKLNKKIDKYQALDSSGAQLFYEVENEKVTRINFTNGRNQLLCEEASCACLQF